MRADEFALLYDTSQHEEHLFNLPHRKEFLLKHIQKGSRVLDLGCCSGYFSRMMMDEGCSVLGMEVNLNSVELARRRGVEVVVESIESPFPFDMESFDAVIAYEIIEHIYDPEHVLKESHKILKPGGKILISTPNLNSLFHRILMVLGMPLHFIRAYPTDNHGEHIRIFNKGLMKKLLDMTGFGIKEIKGVSYLPSPLHYPFHFLPTLADLLLVCGEKKKE